MINPLNRKFQKKDNVSKCPDCDAVLNISCDIEAGEILSCQSCGLELEVKRVTNGGEYIDLQELIIEGEDWGE